jgi:hypothetical protein
MRNNAKRTRGRPFQPGNPGRPLGCRNKATLAAEAILDGEAEALSRKAIELALNGDVAALRICFDRLIPPRRERPIRFAMPPMQTAADATTVIATLMTAVAGGDVSPSEAASMVQILDAYIKSLFVAEFEQRLAKLEAEQNA